MSEQLHVVTGAFGYSGKYLSRMLLKASHRVRTLTNSPDRKHEFGDSIEVHKFNFDDIDKLTESMRCVDVFYKIG
ncbi:MAG: NAD-dependent epimerase/dehydratase family protein [Planctomycetota bacterium]